MITYKEAFDRLTEAYIKGEVNFMDSKFCFCGNLEKKGNWRAGNELDPKLNYTRKQYNDMENVFILPLAKYMRSPTLEALRVSKGYAEYDFGRLVKDYNAGFIELPGYEDALYQAFTEALEILKSIHKERGEDVGDELVFEKRVLEIV